MIFLNTSLRMEIVTGLLSREQLQGELRDIREFFRNHAITASYMYGWGCDIEIDRQWQVNPVAIEAIVETVEEGLASGIFSWGKADLFLYDGEERFSFLLCHEGDVHFTSEDESLVALVRAAWEARGYQVYEARPSP
jgi:hypothetical protein